MCGSWRHTAAVASCKKAGMNQSLLTHGRAGRRGGGIFQQKEPSQRQIYVRLEASRVGQDNTAQQIVVTRGAHTQPANMFAPDGSWELNGSHESVTLAMEIEKGQTKAVVIIYNISYNLNITIITSEDRC